MHLSAHLCICGTLRPCALPFRWGQWTACLILITSGGAMATGATKQAAAHVNAEDQKLINRFARLHQKSVDVKERLQETSRDLQNLNDAYEEVLLMDDAETDTQSVPFQIGTVFVHMDQERLNAKLEHVKGELENQVADLTQEHEKICAEMNSLKSILYGKFGESINLETDTDS